MHKITFKDIYPDATLLDGDFIKNNCSFTLGGIDPSGESRICEQYYIDICSVIRETHYMRLSPEMIERLLIDPIAKNKCGCPTGLRSFITNENQRKYHFLLAQARQLQYDITNGRTAMLRDAEGSSIVAPDALRILDQLGFCEHTPTIKWGKIRP